MAIRVIVFDFDGTLVDSNQLKADAYYALFPADERQRRIIQEVLAERGEQSRYAILEEMLRIGGWGPDTCVADMVQQLAAQYNGIVLAGVKACPAKLGVVEALPRLVQLCSLYLSSTTPQDALTEIVQCRGWRAYFREVFGYPAVKTETLRTIMARERAAASEVLVVGDGVSDRDSAKENGCSFVFAGERFPREEIEQLAGLAACACGER